MNSILRKNAASASLSERIWRILKINDVFIIEGEPMIVVPLCDCNVLSEYSVKCADI